MHMKDALVKLRECPIVVNINYISHGGKDERIKIGWSRQLLSVLTLRISATTDTYLTLSHLFL